MEFFLYAQIGSPNVPGEYMVPGGIVVFLSQEDIRKAQQLGDKALFYCQALKKGGMVVEYKIVEVTRLQ